MTPEEKALKEKVRAATVAIVSTVIYVGLFFPSFYVFMLNPHLFENAEVTSFTGIVLVLLSVCVPVSIIVAIGMIGTHYFRAEYKRMYLYCLLPIAVTIVVLVLMGLIRLVLL